MKAEEEAEERSDQALAMTAARVAREADAAVIVAVTEEGTLARLLAKRSLPMPLVSATPNPETHAALAEEGLRVVRLPLQAADRFGQIRHGLAVATAQGHAQPGELALCVLGRRVQPADGDLLVLCEVTDAEVWPSITDLLALTNGIRPQALEATLRVASKIGQVVRQRSDRIGAIFVLGDSEAVLEQSRQLVPNPFAGHEGSQRTVTNEDLHDALIELAKLDGAFVMRGDGFIRTAAVFLSTDTPEVVVEMPQGLGARHLAAATTTAHTEATAVVVSATDGNVRVFARGKLVLQLDPVVPHGPISVGGSPEPE